MEISHGAGVAEVLNNVAAGTEHPLSGEQAVKTYRAPGVNATRADAHLRS